MRPCFVFDRRKKYQLKINILRCAFDTSSGKFLKFIKGYHGIELDEPKSYDIQNV